MADVSQVMKVLDDIAPGYLKLGNDKIGLQLGSRNNSVDKILVTLEITDEVVNEAIDKTVNLIVSHHPLIFTGLDRVVTDDHVGKLVTRLIKADIAILAAHTNLDRARYGVNDVLAHTLDLQDIEILSYATDVKLFKVVVFVPEEHAEQVIAKLGAAGAGEIGDYRYCAFRASGTGTFYPASGAKPHLGEVGKLNQIAEDRLEMLVTPDKLDNIIETLLSVHPYEEVAYDVYEVENKMSGIGLGRIGDLSTPKRLSECVKLWQEKLGCIFKVAGDLQMSVKRVAVCGGSGADLMGIAKTRGADVFVTGDVKHHSAHAALDMGIAIIDAGHAETERLVVPELAKLLQVALLDLGLDINVAISEIDTSPWNKT